MKIEVPTVAGVSREVDAVDVIAGWAIHPSIESPDDWTVTHVVTGLKIPRYLTRAEAEEIAARLSRDVPFLSVAWKAKPGCTRQPTIKELGPGYPEALRKMIAIVEDVLGEVS